MRQRYFLGLTVALSALLAACGGGGGSGTAAPNPKPSTSSTPFIKPTPTAPPFSIDGHAYIGLDQHAHIFIYPATSPLSLPPGTHDGGPVANAIVIYPDGSKQIADANGNFVPAQSSWARAHAALLASNPQAQPNIIVVDPTGHASPFYAAVPAYQLAAGLIQQQTQRRSVTGFAAKMRPMGTTTNLAGVTLLPEQASLLSSGLVYLSALGTDANNNVVDLAGSTVQWYANYGQVIPLQNGVNAYYIPPDLPLGSVSDTVIVGVSLPGDPNNVFYASSPVNVIAPASAATVAGTVTVQGTPVPGAMAIFAEPGPSQFFSPTLWLAQADSNGNYSAQVPASTKFSLGLGLPPSFSPNGSYGVFLAQQPSGGNSYTSRGAGTNDTLQLTIDPSGVVFSFASPYDLGSVPAYVSFIRNAWYGTHDAVLNRIFEAGTGIQPLLKKQPASFPSPANPAPVGTGQFAQWCYQWQDLGNIPTLILIENTNANCTAPGNNAFAISSSSSGSFTYASYASDSIYPITGTPDVITNSTLVEAGQWSQSVSYDPGGNIISDLATINSGFYDPYNQVLGSPVYSETASYQYSIGSNGLGIETISNDTRVSNFTGTTVSLLNATITQNASYGPTGCGASGASKCFTVSGTMQADVDGSGTLDGSFAIGDVYNGDGSATLTFQTTTSGDSSKIVFPLAPGGYQNANHCMVCANNLGSIYDIDGVTDLGTIQVDNTLLTKVIIYDTPPGQSTIGPDAIDGLGFVL